MAIVRMVNYANPDATKMVEEIGYTCNSEKMAGTEPALGTVCKNPTLAFKVNKHIHNKMGCKRKFKTMIVSLAKEWGVTFEERNRVKKMLQRLCEYCVNWWEQEGFQAVGAVHCNTKHPHFHINVDTCNIVTGMQLSQDYGMLDKLKTDVSRQMGYIGFTEDLLGNEMFLSITEVEMKKEDDVDVTYGDTPRASDEYFYLDNDYSRYNTMIADNLTQEFDCESDPWSYSACVAFTNEGRKDIPLIKPANLVKEEETKEAMRIPALLIPAEVIDEPSEPIDGMLPSDDSNQGIEEDTQEEVNKGLVKPARVLSDEEWIEEMNRRNIPIRESGEDSEGMVSVSGYEEETRYKENTDSVGLNLFTYSKEFGEVTSIHPTNRLALQKAWAFSMKESSKESNHRDNAFINYLKRNSGRNAGTVEQKRKF